MRPLPCVDPAAIGGCAAAVVSREEGLRALQPEWDELLGAMSRPCPFLAWEWVFTWWQHFGRGSQLYLLTLRDSEGRLAGLAPLHIVRRRSFGLVVARSLEFLGYGGSAVCTDHLDFLAPAGCRSAVAAALVAELWRRRQAWDVLVLADLAEDSPVPAAWRGLASRLRLREAPGEVCYYLELPAGVDTLWRRLRARHPEFFTVYGRAQRRLERSHEVKFRGEVGAAEQAAALEELARLHGLARQRRGEGGNFRLPAYRAFHAAVAARLAGRGALYLARLECDGQVVAMLYGYVLAGVLFYYQSGFDTGWSRRGVGKLLLGRVLEDAVTRLGAHELDFLRGEEAYKTRWAQQARRTHHLYGWQPGMRAQMGWLAWRLRARLRALRAALAPHWRRLRPAPAARAA